MKTYKNELAAAIHETVTDLFELGKINKKTLREFDASCLTEPHEFSPEEIQAIRERENVSQAIFAKYLNVSKNLVSDWERGVKRPGGPAMLLLNLVNGGGLEKIGLGH